MIEILSNGALNLVQDLGRPAHLGIGVSGGGAMDVAALAMANWMAGNEEDAAGIEISIFPFRVKFHAAGYFACTGATTTLALQNRNYPSWWAAPVQAGEILTIAPPKDGARAYLAVRGGLDVPQVLGSRSTDLKSGFGGLQGRGLRKGDQLGCLPREAKGAVQPFGVAPATRLAFASQLATGTVRVRAIAAAECPNFNGDSLVAFELSEYRLTPDCNRQGYRLEGVALKAAKTVELLSHGIVPGTIQVPPSGQPIIQLAEANTCGGYPKIATVIEADLWRVAQLRPGHRIRFEMVDHDTALAAMRELEAEQLRIRHGIALMASRA